MGLLLKQLDIHGFKSFATPTTFVFDRGITAIIGPNGSGKSNVAEALRWVLGEQGHANLRSRRTEDIIFAGSDKRSQLSLAEVTLVLDNSDGTLPLAFSEVTVSRRAFRTGENQYLINGGRVRLKDVQQLVAPLGQAYTIIGQGLVDAALSQRPEERRGLFEHAAGISGLRLRANDAERSLNEAGNNAQRLRDIVGELEPRVRSLERSARLAREYGAVRDRLRSAQRLQYAHQWSVLQARHDEARRNLQLAEEACERRTASRARAAICLSELRGREQSLSHEILVLDEQLRTRDHELVRARHQLDLIDTRSHANAERIADLKASLQQLEKERADANSSIHAHRAEISQMNKSVSDLERELEQRDAVIASATARREEMQSDLTQAERSVIELSRRIAGLEGQLQSIADRHASLQAELSDVEEAAALTDQRQAELERLTSELTSRASSLQAELNELDAQAATIDERLAAEQDSARHVSAEAHSDERELAAMRGRLEALERLHMTGEGLYAGVRAIVRALNRTALELPGFIGVLAETIDVPTRYETAIEVALGGHLQDIVVRRWSDAQEAIEFLRREGSGRATFQPLDTVRAARERHVDVDDPDLLGIASDLIQFSADVDVIIRQLLGRTLIVTDLDASRRVVAQSDRWTIVTLTGEITRPSGSVTGGGRTAEAGLLARERERRALPSKISQGEVRLAQLREKEREHTSLMGSLQAHRDVIEGRIRAKRSLLATVRTDLEQRQRELSAHVNASARDHIRRDELVTRLHEVQQAEGAARQTLGKLNVEREDRSAVAEQLRTLLQTFSVESDLRASTLRSELATIRERIRSTEAISHQLIQRTSQLNDAIASRGAEIERLILSEAGIESERAKAAAEIARLASVIASAREVLPPLHAAKSSLSNEVASAEEELDGSIELLREGERERDRASLHVARALDEQVFLVERIRNDLELDDPAELERERPEPEDVPDYSEIARLRERLRRMAVVGPDVVEQYDSESERLNFLTQQLADVDDAALGLRKVLDELGEQMAARFTTTFRDVAAVFEDTFSRLFAGGSARLVYSDGEDGASGIDIVAQPPGKRLQNLNALSGGERALTAVALLIAIQRVNPSPFCLLDEVDAALDESNVLRFRDEVRDLSQSTQFVLITHNRGTIEGADTLYGVTMGDDGISRMLSLRLDDAITAVEAFDAAG